MPRERLSMRKIREVLRLKWECGLSDRQIAQSCVLARSTTSDYLYRAKAAGLTWPLPVDYDDIKLEAVLFPNIVPTQKKQCSEPDWTDIHNELKRKGVTLMLLWQEYKATAATGYSYSQFCHLHRHFVSTLDISMRQTHKAGEKCFVDYAGYTIPIVDAKTGEIQNAEIFVAVLGASNYTFVRAMKSQSLPDWIDAHRYAFEFFQGVPEIIIPDNLKSGITKPHYYDPAINRSYQEMANHYAVAIVPARVRRPQDKSKVEVGVQGIERWLLAPLRNHTFFSVGELNIALRPLLEAYNNKPFQQLPGSRRSQFEILDKPVLRALPEQPYYFAQWKKARAGIDYHIVIDKHYYSVPHRFRQHELDIRLTNQTVECFYKSKLIATHARSYQQGRHTTLTDHMPRAHQEYAEWTPERLINWAKKTGVATAQFIECVIASRPHPQQAYRACQGILRFSKSYGAARLEKACVRALAIGATTYKSIESILKNRLEEQPLTQQTKEPSLATEVAHHSNIRGADYYH
jgi:transposase